MKVLVVDIGGTNVKLLASDQLEPRRFKSGKTLTPQQAVARIRRAAKGWRYEAISLGYPGAVGKPGQPTAEPGNLGPGWVGFDFEKALGRPVRIVNDAVMQALGAYAGGRMLFLGLGTGLGSTLVTDHVIIPLELGSLAYRRSEAIWERLGKKGLQKHGLTGWQEAVSEVIEKMQAAFRADYIVLGGGNAKLVHPLPLGVRRGSNADAFEGGFRLWEETIEPHDRPATPTWRVVP